MIARDLDGDGKTDFAVFRPSLGNWYIYKSSDGTYEIKTWGLGVAPYLDVPVPGDYDGDGKTDLAVFRRQTGIWLYTWKENPRAIRFYTRQGFRVAGGCDFPISKTHSNPNHLLWLEF